jgi:1,4-alpha-glucan branching enzyme
MPEIGAVFQGAQSLVRVFAPNASSVKVYGEWNGWNAATAVDLTPVGGGFWEAPVSGLVAGSRYELLVGRAPGPPNHRLDPAARDTDPGLTTATTSRAWWIRRTPGPPSTRRPSMT